MVYEIPCACMCYFKHTDVVLYRYSVVRITLGWHQVPSASWRHHNHVQNVSFLHSSITALGLQQQDKDDFKPLAVSHRMMWQCCRISEPAETLTSQTAGRTKINPSHCSRSSPQSCEPDWDWESVCVCYGGIFVCSTFYHQTLFVIPFIWSHCRRLLKFVLYGSQESTYRGYITLRGC